MRWIYPPGAALQLVVTERSVNPLPEIPVLDGHHLPEAFPLPAVLPPLGKAETNTFAHVSALRDESHLGGLVEGFQTADNAQQLKPFAARIRINIVGHQTLRPVAGAEHEAPATGLLGIVGLGDEDEVWGRTVHRRLPLERRMAPGRSIKRCTTGVLPKQSFLSEETAHDP